MALHSTAQGLATLGRHGDSVLVHMQPQEVAGLQALAQSQGTSLTVNPNTGMPEAFNLGNFFSSLLPTLAGFMVGGPAGASLGLKAGTTAATLAPIAAGVATGAAVAGAKGEDVLSGALMGGLGGYGGGGLGKSVGNLGAQGGYQTGQAVGSNMNYVDGVESGLSSAGSGQGMATTLAAQAPPSTYMGGLNQMGRGAMDLLKTGGYDKFVSPEIGGSAMQLGSSLGLPVLAGLQPKPFDFAAEEEKRKAEENKYRSSTTGGLNLSPSSGLNLGLPTLAAKGGLMQSYNTGGAVDLNPSVGGGLSDLYNRPEGATNQSLSNDGYGMGRLDRLSQQGSLSKAGDMFYAAGGPVSFANGGDTGMNVEGLPSLNVNTGQQAKMDLMGPTSSMMFNGFLRDRHGTNYGSHFTPEQKIANLTNFYKWVVDPAGRSVGVPFREFYPAFEAALGATQQGPKSYALNLESGKQEAQYAQGGYLDGPGDGLSDSIPATIEGKQPARLADGEFVVSSDVVSGLGNGSSKAGAKKLYAMMDRVRQQAHGTKKQIRKVNEKKVMPDLA